MRHAYWIGILTGIAIALSLLFAEPQRTAPIDAQAYPAPLPPPLPPSAEGYPGPVDPYPYPAPGPTATQWGVIIDCELWWVVCEDEPTPGVPTATAAPTETLQRTELPTPAPTMTPWYWELKATATEVQ